MAESLINKYRPKTFDDVVGNESVVKSLKGIFERREGIPRSMLFTGPSGCGKTTLAYIIKNELECHDRDFLYLNAANDRGINVVRDLDRKSRYKPIGGKTKYYILDEIHSSTKEAQDALLHLLESPPDFLYISLCTTDPDKLLKTVRNRCSLYQMTTLTRVKLIGLLKKVCKEEGVTLPDEAYREIARVSDGSPRAALRTLDQVIDIVDDNELLAAIAETTIAETQALDICRLLVDGKPNWEEMAKAIKGLTADSEEVRYSILGYLNTVLLGKKGGDDRIAKMINLFSESTMYTRQAGLTVQMYLACKL